MSKKLFTLLAALLAISLIAVACGNDDDGPATPVASTAPPEETAEEPVEETAEEPMDEPAEEAMDEPAEEPGTIVEVAVESGAFPTLVAAVQAAGLVETLSGEGPFTVFAPTEEAFGAALAALGLSAEELLGDVDLLTAVLTYHVLPVAAPAEVVLGLDGQSVATVGGEDVQITVDGGSVMVNDATVVTADIEASNGIIHVIDKVLIPPSLR